MLVVGRMIPDDPFAEEGHRPRRDIADGGIGADDLDDRVYAVAVFARHAEEEGLVKIPIILMNENLRRLAYREAGNAFVGQRLGEPDDAGKEPHEAATLACSPRSDTHRSDLARPSFLVVGKCRYRRGLGRVQLQV